EGRKDRPPTGGAADAASEAQADLGPLLAVAWPLVHAARARLRAALAGAADAGEPPHVAGPPQPVLPPRPAPHARAIEASVMPALETRLLHLLGPALILELRIAQHEGLLGDAGDESPAADGTQRAIHAFARRLARRDGALAFFAGYPVLARLATA